MVIAIILAALAAVLFFIAPSCGKRRAQAWCGTPFAHRGLHGFGASENSLGAFEQACRCNVGIEMDVQLSADGEVVVFHDDTLLRMTGDKRRVDSLTLAQLKVLVLPDGSRIPTLAEALRRIDGRSPVLVEIKNGKSNARLCEAVMQLLASYPGAYLVESFNPFILRWLRRHAPQAVRGQLVSTHRAYLGQFGGFVAFLLSALALNFLARPDFIAYDANARPFFTPSIQRRLFCAPMAAWTITTPEAYAECLRRGEMPIFEGFIPESGAA